MIRLHHCPSTAAMIPHIVLEEIGVPYERVPVDRQGGAHKQPAYLQLNPNGLIPVLEDGDLVVYETAAIVMHLCDTHPQAHLAPPPGGAERAHFYQWMAWLTNTLQAALIVYFYPERWMNDGNTTGVAELKSNAERRIVGMLGLLDTELARHGGPWFAPGGYSALDAYVFTLCRWTRNFRSTPARALPDLGPYLQRMLERPAVKRVIANEQLSPPLV
ncbi:glutathione S-transferase family protein [Caenimonas aquaedulcis]|uniref:Glutathione S-transferase family protein n=1 Tax=Caenimonas aquaedulcis TaxID=2793270 RepID=A0A931MHH5_9BURK|nr:glutathione S-transferase family protein [Caenimonas aquaedulcis]MBG9388744.1 glutathione S-transferase family protein [Caenimonas aquaedulcis]